MHWAKDCPHGKNIKQQSANVIESDGQQADDKGYEECELILLAKKPDKFQIFVAEAAKSAVVDTACTKTVGGLHWFNSYIDSLDEEQRKKVKIFESNTSFKFGDGRQVKSQKRARIPAQIENKSCLIEMEIVKENIPLLLSKSSLKKAETVLDMKIDQAVMFGKEVNLYFSTSGHYCIDIQPNKLSKMDLPVERQSENVLIFEENMTLSDKKKHIQKIHGQFGHASSENIKRLMKNDGVTEKEFFEIIDEVIQGCDVCLKNKKPVPRPVVGFALSN